MKSSSTPTDSRTLDEVTPKKLANRLRDYWQVVADNSDVSEAEIAEQALVAPARCCLKNIGEVGALGESAKNRKREAQDSTIEEQVVEKTFDYLKNTSRMLRERYGS